MANTEEMMESGASNTGRVAINRLQQLVSEDDSRNKNRNVDFLKTVLGMEKVIRAHQKAVDEMKRQVEDLTEMNSTLKHENEELNTTIIELVDVTNRAAEILEDADNERDDIFARMNSLVREAEENSDVGELLSLTPDDELNHKDVLPKKAEEPTEENEAHSY